MPRSQNILLTVLTVPPGRTMVQLQLSKVRQGIETKLVPQRGDMVRHLELPQQGQSAEWILEEMSRMDKEAGAGSESKDGGRVDWREGKVSGAVYRTYFPFPFHSLVSISHSCDPQMTVQT